MTLARTRLFTLWAPFVLVLLYSLWACYPRREALIGMGDDPAFNAWTFLHLFRSFDAQGIKACFGPAWNAPIFAPGNLQLALSENQLAPALLLWPVWKLTGSVVATLNLGMIGLHLAAFFAAAGWLSRRGVRELCFWGGLVFASCGFLQAEYVHWQNGCIFVFPLALWAWEAFRERPTALRIVFCAASFGWIAAWNLYFFLMGGMLLAILAAHAWFRRLAPRASVAALFALSLGLSLPILIPYAEVAGRLGGFGVHEFYPADAWSWLRRPLRPSFLSAHFQGWPVPRDENAGAAGFLGFAWVALALAAVRIPRARGPLFFAALAYWASLGPGYLLYDVLRALPGFSGLRAVGRFQIGVAVAALAAAFTWLEGQPTGWKALFLGILLLELAPARPALRVHIPAAVDGPLTPLELAMGRSPDPVLPVPDASAQVQLAVLRSGTTLGGGYSGRSPPPFDLIGFRALEGSSLADLLAFTGAKRVLTTSVKRTNEARGSAALAEIGCFDALGTPVCLFEVVLPPYFGERTTLEIEGLRVTPVEGKGADISIMAMRAGVLDLEGVARCQLVRELKFPLIPSLRYRLPLAVRGFQGLRFERGQTIYSHRLAGAWARWPNPLRPRLTVRLSCR